MSVVKFKIKNNAARSYGLAGRMCIAGAGCSTPPDLVQKTNFRFEPAFELSESEMFKSYRGVIAAMQTVTPQGKPDLELTIDGVPNGLKVEDLTEWAENYRAEQGMSKPVSSGDHVAEVERAMNRPPDPIEVALERAQTERDRKMAETVARTVAEVLRGQSPPATPPATPPAAGRGRPRGRNDEVDDE